MPISDLVQLVYIAEGAGETDEIEWKLEFPLDTRPRRAALAKHVIAFANRDPDRAARTFGGHAFILIGVEPGRWGMAPELDPAEIVQQLEPFTGSELPWHPVYTELDGHRVLTVVVDPPQWGDPIYRFVRGSQDPDTGKEIKAGTVFVRQPGVSRPADEDQLRRLQERANVPRPRLTVVNDWNLGTKGDYVAVNVTNGIDGRRAVLHEVGFTIAGTCEISQLPDGIYAPATPEDARAYASLPIHEEDCTIEPGQTLTFQVPLGRPPFFWDAETQIYPYAYFDQGHWLVGEPAPLVGQLLGHGWMVPEAAPPMFSVMTMNYVAPPSVSGLRARFDLAAVEGEA